jgi:hypothetical protein
MADLLRIARPFGADETASAAAAWASAFPEPGVYRVERLEHFAKAAGVGGQPTDDFEEWFLRRLFEVSRENFVDSQQAIWGVLDDLLRARGVEIPSQLDQWELGRTLFDLTHASTAHMVGLRVPADVTHRLTELGWKAPEVLDFPALAYRMGLIYHELQASAPTTWPRLLELTEARPLSAVEQLAVDAARSRAGVWLRPIFDDTGHVWTAERELEPLRELTSRAIAERRGYRAAARELGKTNRAQGIFRDTERVMRTEIATANGQANWADQSKRWETETKIYRPTTATPCRDCLRLYKLPDGMPRLYTRAEVEAESAKGPNTGPRDTWGPRIGPTHVNCCCPPWQTWQEALRPILARRAARFAEMIKTLRVFDERKAA